MQRTLLTLALIATAGAAYAQPMQGPLDPRGNPYIGRNDWVRQPGDERGPVAGRAPMGPEMAMAPAGSMSAPDALPPQRRPHQAAMKDEFGFRYDAQGNRLDARGNIISPQTR
jgi:hypothetical protein